MEVTCDGNSCTAPDDDWTLFETDSFPENDLKPGYEFIRQIKVNNTGEEVCFLTIDNFSNINAYLLGENGEPYDDPDQQFADFLYSSFVHGTEPPEEKSFAELFGSTTPIYVGEVAADDQETFDWQVRFAESAGNDYQGAKIVFDFDFTFQCGFEETGTDILSIEKSNNAVGLTKSPEENVTYELKISTADSPVYNVVAIDLAPEGFIYRGGSWSATSDVRGDLKDLGVTGEPTYASPGTWQLGDMKANETVTLTYVADISEDTEPGEHPDIAWAYGDTEGDPESADVLANEDSGYFVGTDVEVGKEAVSPDADVEVEEEEVEGEVLGAEEDALPATGADNIWAKIVLGLFGAGVLFVLYGFFRARQVLYASSHSEPFRLGGMGEESPAITKDSFSEGDSSSRTPQNDSRGDSHSDSNLSGGESRAKASKILGILIFGFLALATPRQAFAANVMVRLQEPESHINTSSFKLNFVVLDIEERPVTVKCYQKSPGTAVFSKFGSTANLDSGGDSGYCAVGSNVLDTEGEYSFYVEAEAGGDKSTSSTVIVKYDEDAPDEPEHIKKDEDGCEDEIEIEVADDGETDYIHVYRAKDTEFEANSDTRFEEIDVDSGEEVEFSTTRPDCSATYYYAVIAYDEAGNRSDVTVEKLEKEVTVTVSEEEEEGEAVAGAEVVAEGEAQVAAPGEEAEVGEGEALEEEEGEEPAGEEEQGEIAGAEVEEGTEEAAQVGVQSAVSNFLSKGGWIILGIVALIIAYLGKRFLSK